MRSCCCLETRDGFLDLELDMRRAMSASRNFTSSVSNEAEPVLSKPCVRFGTRLVGFTRASGLIVPPASSIRSVALSGNRGCDGPDEEGSVAWGNVGIVGFDAGLFSSQDI